jgi:hypothetical protein
MIVTLKNNQLAETARIFCIDGNAEICDYLTALIKQTADKGFCSRETVWSPDSTGAITMHQNDKIMGLIAFKHAPYMHDNKKLLQILIGGVSDDYVGQGAYKLLHKELEAFAKETGFNGIYSYIRTNNLPMMKSIKSLGKEIITVLCYKEV